MALMLYRGVVGDGGWDGLTEVPLLSFAWTVRTDGGWVERSEHVRRVLR
jgi:hypothetical protein